MNKYFLAIVVAILSLIPLTSSAQSGTKSVGVFGGFNSETESALAGVYFQYGCNNWLRLSPNFQMIFKKNDLSAFHINGNANFVLPLSGNFNLYALGGISYQSWRFSNILFGDNDLPEDMVHNRFGLATGGGVEVFATKSLKFMAEGKYSFVKDYSAADFFVGIGYVF
ncbi:MAG: outer membrane protein [Muribaculaceae bacterium]